MNNTRKSIWNIYVRCIKIAIKSKTNLTLIFIFSLLSAGLSIFSSMTLKYVVDVAIPLLNINLLWIYQAVFFLCVLLSSILGILAVVFANKIWSMVQREIRGKMYSHLLKVDYSVLQNLEKAKVHTAINQGVDALEEIFMKGISIALGYVLSIFITLFVMFATDWRLTLLSLPVFPLMIKLFAKLNKDLSKVFGTLQKQRTKLTQSTQENIDCIINIRNYNMETDQIERFSDVCDGLGNAMAKRNYIFELMNRASWTLIMVPYQAILFGVGGTLAIIYGIPTIGTLLIFSNFTNYLIQPVMSLTGISNQLSMAKDSFERIDEILGLPQKIKMNYPNVKNKENVAELVDLGFSYEGQSKKVFENLNFDIPNEGTTILWGKSGSGKSTILKIIADLLPLKNNESIRKNTQKKWSYFPQNPSLFEDSIRNNFLRVCPNLTEEGIFNLLDKVGLLQIIKNKENSIDSQVNRNEHLLSGGEYRRLCLAIFLSFEADVLLLDEPTASLDEYSSRVICKVLEDLSLEKRTLVVSTHDAQLKAIGNSICDLY